MHKRISVFGKLDAADHRLGSGHAHHHADPWNARPTRRFQFAI
ncbi:MAG: hypothetical protein R3E96_14885 [Planctomycetota bacterium]